MKSDLRSVRITGFIEAISAIALFCVAMPLKYFAEMPKAVTVVGSIHGLLWVIYAIVVFMACQRKSLSWVWFGILGLLSFIPFGPFLVDGKIKKMEKEAAN